MPRCCCAALLLCRSPPRTLMPPQLPPSNPYADPAIQVRAESEAVKTAMEHSKAEIDTARALHAEASRDKWPR